MKKYILICLSIVAATGVSFAQVKLEPIVVKTFKPLVVLNSGDKTVKFESTAQEYYYTRVRFSLNDIDPNQIKSIEVLKDRAAIEQYGVEAINGVIVLNLKDFDFLPDKTKKLFEKEEKK
jgi:hypothetical protein